MSVTAGPHNATVAFTPPTNDGGVRISYYRATCTSTNRAFTNAHQAVASPITVGGLSVDDTYTCTVAAKNSVSIGPASAPSTPFIPLSG